MLVVQVLMFAQCTAVWWLGVEAVRETQALCAMLCCVVCRVILDDFREAYYWLRHNTATDAKIMSW